MPQTPVPGDLSAMTLLPLKNGPNQLDVDGDGWLDQVFVAWRDNANAHGFSHITFYRSASGDPAWSLVPFFDARDAQAFTAFDTYEGADCVLKDLRVLRPRQQPSSPVVVVVAERRFGETFTSREPVTFTVYRAARNSGGIAGSPPFYFRAAQTTTSKGAYCDVDEAFAGELGIARQPR